MKILFPSYAFYPDQGGGPSSSIYWLSKKLVKSGIDVDVVVTTRGLNGFFPSNKDVIVDGIKVRYCSYLLMKFPLKVIYHSLRKVRNSDIVHFSSVYFSPNFLIGLYALILKKKIVWSPRGEFAGQLKINPIKKVYLKLFAKLFSAKVYFHGTSEKEIEEIKNTMGANVKTVLLPNYLELPDKIDCFPEKELLFMGRINPVKALDCLIDALSLSTRFKESEYKFIIAGVPAGKGAEDYYEELKKQVVRLALQEKVHFIGHIKGEEKNREYAKAYFTFLVSHTENFGNVVVESMAQGTPVVTSIGTPWKVLNEKSIGYCVSNSPQSIANVIDEILSLPEDQYSRMREGAYQYCVNEFSVVHNINKWIAYYNQIEKQ